jgi:zinc transport system substrate-binding protein
MRIVVMYRRLAALSAIALVAPLAGCSGDDGGGPDVVTSIYPLQYLVERIVRDRVEVVNLTQPGQESHDFELGIEQTALLSEAGTVIYLPGFQPAVDEAVEQQEPPHVLKVSDSVELHPMDDHEHPAGDEEGHSHEGEHDPHFWLDPELMVDVATAVEGSLSELHPDDAEAFAARLDTLTADLAELDEDYRDGLADCERTDVVVGHDAFGYLAKYGLELHPIAGLSPGAEPSPARLAELSEVIEETGVTTVFSEVLASPAMAETLSDELGLSTAVLDPIEGLADKSSDEDYVSLMQKNLAALRKANGCR